jgi:hypothetical protein
MTKIMNIGETASLLGFGAMRLPLIALLPSDRGE